MEFFKQGVCVTLAVLFSVILAAKPSAAAERITVAGDPCSVPLMAKLAEAYSQNNREFKAEVSTYSCTLGVYNAASGQFDIGVSTQNGLTSNLPKGAKNTVIAKSPIILIVNKSNPVNNLTYAQLQGIFSGKITNWKEVGGRDMEIRNVMLEPCVRLTLSKQVIMYGKDINLLEPGKKVNPVTYTNKMVAENESSIGQQIYGYESDDVKVLTIDGVLPDEETLPSKYTFYQDYNVVTKGEPTGVVKELIQFAFKKEGQKIIRSMRHIPVSK